MNWVYYFANLANPLPQVSTNGRLQIIVLAGFRYIISQGNPNEVATAKNAIIYSLVGLVVIMFAFAIVNFVLEGVS